MRTHRSLLPAALCASALVTAGPAAAAPPVQRPFHDEGSGTGTSPSPFVRSYTGTHIGSHLGKGTFSAGANLLGNPFLGCVHVTGGATLTAANGDQVRSVLQPGGLTCPGPSGFTTTARYQIVGGTGRFAGAGGQGDFTSLDTLSTFAYVLDGTIVY